MANSPLFQILWVLAAIIVGVVMAGAWTGPHRSVSNLSRWATRLHIRRVPAWLSARALRAARIRARNTRAKIAAGSARPTMNEPGGGDNIACQRRANIGRWFAQRSAFCCRAAPPGKAADNYGFPRKNLVGVRGFEPPAPASRKQCSTRLSYTPPTGRDI